MIEHRDLEYWKKEIKKYSDKVNEIFKSSKDRIELTESLLEGIRNFVSSVECFVAKANENKSYAICRRRFFGLSPRVHAKAGRGFRAAI